MQLGEVRVANESDFSRLLELASDEANTGQAGGGWELAAKKRLCSVYTQNNSLSAFKMIKIVAEVKAVAASTVYDCLHDSSFRPVWDTNLAESKQICVVDSQNDIGYYQVKTPKPLRRRDFVTQRSWRQSGDTYMILNHSVFHKAEPPRKGIIRGKSFYTGYVIRSTGAKSCTLTYISQSDPGGNQQNGGQVLQLHTCYSQVWFVRVCDVKRLDLAISFFERTKQHLITEKMVKASSKYESWKAKNEPGYMPWRWPDQIRGEFIDWEDVVTQQDQEQMADQAENLSDLTEGDVEIPEEDDN